jgi:hypothetical protein
MSVEDKPENPHVYPQDINRDWSGKVVDVIGGMTLRDYFAAAALQAMANASDAAQAKDTAHRAYMFADAMLKARGK